MVYSVFLRKQADCNSFLLFTAPCSPVSLSEKWHVWHNDICDSLITGINSGWSCYSMLQFSASVRLHDSLYDRLQTTGNLRHLSVYPDTFSACLTRVEQQSEWSSKARNSTDMHALSRILSCDALKGKTFWTRRKSESCKSGMWQSKQLLSKLSLYKITVFAWTM